MINTKRKKVMATLVPYLDLSGRTLKQFSRDIAQYSAKIEALGGSNAYFDNFGEDLCRIRYSRWETDVEWCCRVMAEHTAFKDATKRVEKSELQAARDEIKMLKALNDALSQEREFGTPKTICGITMAKAIKILMESDK